MANPDPSEGAKPPLISEPPRKFIDIWRTGITDPQIKKELNNKEEFGDGDEDKPQSAVIAETWDELNPFCEYPFSTEPYVALHKFKKGPHLWLLADPSQPGPKTKITESFKSLEELVNKLIELKVFDEQTLFPAGRSQSPVTPDPDLGPNPRQQTHPPPFSHENGEEAQELNEPQPQPSSSGFRNGTTPHPQPEIVPPTQTSAYPFDLLLRLRQTYKTSSTQHALSYKKALELTRNHPRANVENDAEHTLFRRFDPEEPAAALKATHHPKLRWEIQIPLYANSHLNSLFQLPLPSQLTHPPDFSTLLDSWKAFKEYLPLYRGIMNPAPNTNGYIDSNGQVFINPDPHLRRTSPVITFESARALNQFLDPDSEAQKKLIKACLDESRTSFSPPQPGQRSLSQYQSQAARLEAYAMALYNNNHPDSGPTNILPPLRVEQAITLLDIKATEEMISGRQILYAKITRAFQEKRTPLTYQERDAIAAHFPKSCRNEQFIAFIVKQQGIIPKDPGTQYHLVSLACEKADSRLLSTILDPSWRSGQKLNFDQKDIAQFTEWILHKAHPDKARARRCLDQLPLSLPTRIKINAQFKKNGWTDNQSQPTHSTHRTSPFNPNVQSL